MRSGSRIPRRVVLALVIAAAFTPSATSGGTCAQTEDAAAFYQQGLLLAASEKFDEAIKAFSQAVKLKPEFAEAYLQLGEAYWEQGEPKKALEAYKQSLKYQPNSARAHADLGTAYAFSDYKKAVEAYNEAIRIDPKAPSFHYKLGELHASHGKEQLAVGEYKILQTLDPGLAQDLYNVVYKPIVPVIDDGVVRLHLIALDSRGDAIKDLSTSAVTVAEDGTPQTISLTATADSAVFIGLAIDTSGSLRSVFSSVIKASKQMVEKLRADDQAFLVRFISSDKIETIQDFTSSKRRLRDGIEGLYIEGGQTAVLDAVYLTAQRLASYKFPNRNPRRIMLLLSDGEDRQSYYSLPQVLDLLGSMDIQIFAISFNDNGRLNPNALPRSVQLLKKLTSETGGATFFPQTISEMVTSVNTVVDLARSEYTVEYKSPAKADRHRSVSVAVLPNSQPTPAVVIARTGYNLPTKLHGETK